MIAIALTATVFQTGNTFYALSLTVLPTLVLLGLFSYARIMQTRIEDLACAASIGRIRRHYAAVDRSQATAATMPD